MDEQRKKEDPTLVCTCNDLYVDDIEEAIAAEVVEYIEIMQYTRYQSRCFVQSIARTAKQAAT